MYIVEYRDNERGWKSHIGCGPFVCKSAAESWISDRIAGTSFYSSDYRVVCDTPSSPPKYVVINLDTKFRDDNLYNSRKDAVSRAQEMCKQQPNRKFYVAEIKACYRADVTVKEVDV